MPAQYFSTEHFYLPFWLQINILIYVAKYSLHDSETRFVKKITFKLLVSSLFQSLLGKTRQKHKLWKQVQQWCLQPLRDFHSRFPQWICSSTAEDVVLLHMNVWTVWLHCAVGFCCKNTCSAKHVGRLPTSKNICKALFQSNIQPYTTLNISLNLSHTWVNE